MHWVDKRRQITKQNGGNSGGNDGGEVPFESTKFNPKKVDAARDERVRSKL